MCHIRAFVRVEKRTEVLRIITSVALLNGITQLVLGVTILSNTIVCRLRVTVFIAHTLPRFFHAAKYEIKYADNEQLITL